MWLAWLTIDNVGPVEGLLVLSPLVLHPLILRLVAFNDDAPRWLFRIVTWSQLPAAAALTVSFSLDRGSLAAGLAVPWLIVALATAAFGGLRILARGLRPAWALTTDAGLIFVAVGGMWTVASRYGMRPFSFSDTIVLLTGVHFHYAGLVLPVLAGLVARVHAKRHFDAAAVGVIAAVPLTAVGITLSPVVEVFSAVLLAACGFAIAFGQLLLARSVRLNVTSLLFGLSSLSLMFAMTLAVLYSTSEFRGVPWPSIAEMAQWHGTLNALGTCLLGVWAWTIEGPKDP